MQNIIQYLREIYFRQNVLFQGGGTFSRINRVSNIFQKFFMLRTLKNEFKQVSHTHQNDPIAHVWRQWGHVVQGDTNRKSATINQPSHPSTSTKYKYKYRRVQFIGNKAIASNKMSIQMKLFPIILHGGTTVHTTPRVELPEQWQGISFAVDYLKINM